jgi:hypothetical protein
VSDVNNTDGIGGVVSGGNPPLVIEKVKRRAFVRLVLGRSGVTRGGSSQGMNPNFL